jgi:anti-sigma B factor antagonist
MPSGERDRTQLANWPVPTSVGVEIRSGCAAIVTLAGEHDLRSNGKLRRALACGIEQPDVLVDLTACTFIDSSAMGALVSASQVLAEGDGRLQLVVPLAATHVSRAVRLAAISAAVVVHEARAAAEASIRPPENAFSLRSWGWMPSGAA